MGLFPLVERWNGHPVGRAIRSVKLKPVSVSLKNPPRDVPAGRRRSCALPVEETERILSANQGSRMKISTNLLFAAGKQVMARNCGKITHLVAFGALVLILGVAVPAAAHPVPFSY